MAVFVTGDYHGGFEHYKLDDWVEGSALGRNDYLIVAGDFGLPWDFSTEECDEILWLETRPYTVLFCDGNHEHYEHWLSRPREEWRGGVVQRISNASPIRRLCRGEVFELDGSKIFVMGGATSVDKQQRTPYIDWWPCELPDEEEIEHARASLDACDWQVDYVITHTCSNMVAPRALYPSFGWQYPDTDRLMNFFDELEERLDYKKWYFGHFHRDRVIDDKHTLLYEGIVRLGS